VLSHQGFIFVAEEGLFYDPYGVAAQRKSLATLRVATGFIISIPLKSKLFSVCKQ
jgi:hypothetical protein